jgi:hypothetical protein
MAEAPRLAAALQYQQGMDDITRPATVNPMMARQVAKSRELMTAPTSIMDERYPAWKKAQEDADLFLLGADAAGLAPFAAKGAVATAKFAAPKIAQGLEQHMIRSGMMPHIFIGENAKNWNASQATMARQMEKAGASPQDIWRETGTWKGPEGSWRQEISDAQSKITEAVPKSIVNSQDKMFKGLLGEGLSHDELYKAYPELQNIKANFYADINPSGSYAQNAKSMVVGAPSTGDQRSVALHELQHAIQQKEGFARGGSPESMIMTLEEIAQEKRQKAKELFNLSKANDPLDPSRIVKPGARKKGLQLEREAQDIDSKAVIANLSGQARFDLYRSLAGEAEARATQRRRNLTTEQRRATFPEESYDVPISDLIIRR